MTRTPRRGFTLTELVVVIVLAVIVAAVAVMLPAKGGSGSSPRTRSMSNLHQLTTVIALYASDNGDLLPNPFDATVRNAEPWQIYVGKGSWEEANVPADSCSYYWATLVAPYIGVPPVDSSVAPLDTHSEKRFAAEWGTKALIPTSYWYSATAYYNPSRFAGPQTGSTAVGGVWENIRRNPYDEVTHPGLKALLFEKQDFRHARKVLFAHPEADAVIGMADGSCRTSRNDESMDAIQQDPALAPSGGNWADPTLAEYGMDSKEEGLAEQQGLYPAFYHWTRDGIHGRDLL
jgi:prepilin-type N-terminal cleavage/methylation domain-containing protein